MNQEQAAQEFMAVFSEYGDAIFRFCVYKVSNKERAEDMTQEVFMRYWQYVREGKEMTNVRSLLYTIAHNLAKDWYKKKKSESLDVHVEAGHEPIDVSAQPERDAEYQEVLSAIKSLDAVDADVLWLRHVEGLEPQAIAVTLGVSANVVSVRLNRAMKRLQQKIGV